MTLSVCLIVKDEQEVIARCLTCAEKFADEIIVVDTGSSDATVAEAAKFTDKIFHFEWCDDFSAARNYAFDRAGCDLVMWLDADDVVEDADCRKIVRLKEEFDGYDMAFMPYVAACDGDRPTFVYNRERIFRRSKNYKFSGAVHEAVSPAGRIFYSDAAVRHMKVKPRDPLRNLTIIQRQIASGKPLDGRMKFYYGRELLFNGMYREAAAVLEDYLSGEGWAVNKSEACLNLYDAYTAAGEGERALCALVRSFVYGPLRGRACCILGGHFLESGDLHSAVYWYKSALSSGGDIRDGGFADVDFTGYIPYIQLCVAYDRLGDYERAESYNEAAGRIKPDSRAYLENKKYFLARRGGRGENI